MKNSDKYFSATGGDTSSRYGIFGILFFVIGVILVFTTLIGIILILTGIYLFMINQYVEIDLTKMQIRNMDYFPPFKSGSWINIKETDHLSLTYSKESSPSYYVGAFYRQRKVQNAWFDVHIVNETGEKIILLFTSETYGKSLKKLIEFKEMMGIRAIDHINEHRKKMRE